MASEAELAGYRQLVLTQLGQTISLQHPSDDGSDASLAEKHAVAFTPTPGQLRMTELLLDRPSTCAPRDGGLWAREQGPKSGNLCLGRQAPRGRDGAGECVVPHTQL